MTGLTLAQLAAFNITLLAAMASPGPAFLLVLRNSMAEGRTAGILTGLGLGLVAALWTAAALLGLAALFDLVPWLYGAMKAALAHFTTCLAAGYGRKGIRVNGIGPDVTQTPQVDYLTGYEDAEALWESWAPVGRLGWPDDPARVALFLASDMSSFVTGHNIPVDGGTKAGSGWFYSPAAQRFVNRPKTL